MTFRPHIQVSLPCGRLNRGRANLKTLSGYSKNGEHEIENYQDNPVEQVSGDFVMTASHDSRWTSDPIMREIKI